MRTTTRRHVLKQGSALAVLTALGGTGLLATQARAAEANPFEAKNLDELYKALGGKPQASTDIAITSPDIAENGAVVPISVTSSLPKTQEIYIVVEKNPSPLSAAFVIHEGTEPFVSTRTKMGESTDVHAIVKADGKLYSVVKETKVTLGGCGG